MKFYYLFGILLVVLYTTFAKNIQNVNKGDGVNLKLKRSVTSNECKYINGMLEKDDSYDCCKHEGIECENGHITKMYFFFFFFFFLF